MNLTIELLNVSEKALLISHHPIMQVQINRQTCSLPYRQLRKKVKAAMRKAQCSLPYRQLRKLDGFAAINGLSSLPYRQLRNR